MELKDYSRLKDQMILRDYLALDRTNLAAERTFLAYCRTAVGLLASGVGMIKLINEPLFTAAGYAFIAGAPVVLVIGLIRYLRILKKLHTLS